MTRFSACLVCAAIPCCCDVDPAPTPPAEEPALTEPRRFQLFTNPGEVADRRYLDSFATLPEALRALACHRPGVVIDTEFGPARTVEEPAPVPRCLACGVVRARPGSQYCCLCHAFGHAERHMLCLGRQGA